MRSAGPNRISPFRRILRTSSRALKGRDAFISLPNRLRVADQLLDLKSHTLPRGGLSASDNLNHSNAPDWLVPDLKPTQTATGDRSRFPSDAQEGLVSG